MIEDLHGPTEFDEHWYESDFTSRLDYINSADAILLLGLEIREKYMRARYPIVENLDDVKPPLIPIAAKYKFFPGDEAECANQRFDSTTSSFLDLLVPNCPHRKIPVRSEWVGRVLQQNGYQTVLTGDPGWYDIETLGAEFHRPERIDQLVFTAPHKWIYVEQAKELMRRLGREFSDADRILSLHNAKWDIDRALYDVARRFGWEIRHVSHDTENIEFYRDSDLHVGYRKHGHLAHLRWQRPSIVLAEDSRVIGMSETLGAGVIPAFVSRKTTGLEGIMRRLHDTKPIKAAALLSDASNSRFADAVPPKEILKAKPDPDAIDDVFRFIERQQSNNWSAYTQTQNAIEETYTKGMRPYLASALEV